MSTRSEIFYELVERFYTSRIIFEDQRDAYEAAVLLLVERMGIPREMLWLPPEKLASLLDFKVLSDLCDLYLQPLRDCTRRLLGGEERDVFDIMVSDIYHLMSILKEEEFRVSHYAVLYDQMQKIEDRDYILTSATHDFPILLNQTHNLFQQAMDRLHLHLPGFAQDPLVIRSIYLHGRWFLDRTYETTGGLDGFYEHMYPDGGALEAYLAVARSFLESAFETRAQQALTKARQRLDPDRTNATHRRLAEELHRLTRLVPPGA